VLGGLGGGRCGLVWVGLGENWGWGLLGDDNFGYEVLDDAFDQV
jgi:hypothetical protein